MERSNHYYIGVDIGGTNIKFGLVNESGNIIDRSHLSTISCGSTKNELINSLTKAVELLIINNQLKKRDIAGVGFGLPGLVDAKTGMVASLTNIVGWKNVPFKKLMEEHLGLPVFIDNDVNVIALAEWKYGAGKGCDNLICMTLGTGVGGGLILGGGLYRGEGFAAGEIGHVPLNEEGPACNCGGYGCFEVEVGNKQLLAKAIKVFKKKNLRLEEVSQMAGEGNKRALKFWEDEAKHIGNGLVGVVNILNPKLIIIGGGISKSFKFLEKEINATIKRRAMKVQGAMVKVVKGKLGDDAGILGAQVLIKEMAGKIEK